MNITKKYFLLIFAFLSLLGIISGLIFYKAVIGDDSTPIFSVIFGWQWIYILIASLILLVIALLKKSKNFCIAALITIASLAVVLIPSKIVEITDIYIVGYGGPAGPNFSCLVWDDAYVEFMGLGNDSYTHDFGWCTLMSIPSYNKFLIDRSEHADSEDTSFSYYLMLAANETIVVGGLYIAYRKLVDRTKA